MPSWGPGLFRRCKALISPVCFRGSIFRIRLSCDRADASAESFRQAQATHSGTCLIQTWYCRMGRNATAVRASHQLDRLAWSLHDGLVVHRSVFTSDDAESPVMYSMCCCFFAQLHVYIEFGYPAALQSMQEASRCFQEWSAGEIGVPDGQRMLRTKVSRLSRAFTHRQVTSSIICIEEAVARSRHDMSPNRPLSSQAETSNVHDSDSRITDSIFPGDLTGLNLFGTNNWPWDGLMTDLSHSSSDPIVADRVGDSGNVDHFSPDWFTDGLDNTFGSVMDTDVLHSQLWQ